MNQTALSVRNMVLAALFAALLAISGLFQIPIPMIPAPITLQTMVVMLAGSLLGPRLSAVSMGLFLALAAVGAPVLAGGGGGLGALMGPTGGYVVSWPLAAFIVGIIVHYFAKKGTLKAWHIILAHVAGGILVVHLIGFPWLVTIMNLPLNMKTFVTVVLMYMPGDLIKAIVAVPIVLAMYRAIPWLRPQGK